MKDTEENKPKYDEEQNNDTEQIFSFINGLSIEEDYDMDFEGALRRSEKIAEDERKRAEQASRDWEVLERFGLIL